MSSLESQKAVQELLLQLQSCVIVSHVNPDPDAMGSCMALAEALESAGVTVSVLNQSGLPASLSFLADEREVVTTMPEGSWDALLVLDCGDAHRIGDSLLPILEAGLPVINIDHHYNNSLFGTMNLLRADASSTCEIIYELLDHPRFTITPSIAASLYAGLLGDTGSFRYSSCSARTLRIAASLLESGVHPETVSQQLYGSTPRSVVVLKAKALSKLSVHAEGRIAFVVIDNAMFLEAGVEASVVDGLAETVRDIQGVEVAAYIRQDTDLWKVSLRSTDERFNVAEVAESFGGGGHKQAAAFRYRQSRESLQEALLSRLETLLEEAL